jgi:hypothetical protein
LERGALPPAQRDAFQPLSLPPPEPPPVVAVQPPPAPVLAPIEPAVPYSYLGRMIEPDGKTVVYLTKGGTVVVAKVGDQLDDGYIVQAISNEAIQLMSAPTSGSASAASAKPMRIEIPSAPAATSQ